MKKILCLMMSLIMIFSCITAGMISASAASCVIAFSKKQINVGDSVTVTVTISASETMYGYGFELHYDPEILEVKLSGSQEGGAGIARVADSGKTSKVSEKFTFKALKSGECYIKTSKVVYGNYDYEDVSVVDQGGTITVKDESLSANANLKSLSVSDGKLSPAFSASTTSYKVTVGNNVTDCNIYATSADSNAKVKVEGGSDLKIGSNSCTVTVTAPSGAQKVYKITITRTEEVISSETDSSEDETSSAELGSLETEIDGVVYTLLQNIDNIEIPLGFAAEKIIYNAAEVAVIKDEEEKYTIYFMTSAENTTPEPYVLDTESNTFEKLKYIKQGGRYYIIEENNDNNGFDGYYATHTEIGGFDVNCYASNKTELADFSYIYCFNGEEYEYYRYDSSEKVLARYPEMRMSMLTSSDVEDEESFGEKFGTLSSNRKIIVIGIFLLIICFLILVILIVARIIHHRRGAEFATNLNYTDEFDSVDYDNKFSMENSGFVADDDEVLSDLDFGDDENENEAPNYLMDDEDEETQLPSAAEEEKNK